MIISIASTGGTPGSSPNRKTRTTCRRRPRVQGRCRPRDAERDEADHDEALRARSGSSPSCSSSSSPLAAAGRCSMLRGAAPSAGVGAHRPGSRVSSAAGANGRRSSELPPAGAARSPPEVCPLSSSSQVRRPGEQAGRTPLDDEADTLEEGIEQLTGAARTIASVRVSGLETLNQVVSTDPAGAALQASSTCQQLREETS